jgi:hypothetical protein
MRSFSPPERVIGWLLPAFALVAEAALLAVAYAAITTAIEGRPPILGTFELTVAAAVTALAVHRGWLDPDERPIPFLALLFAIGAAGWLWDVEARRLLLGGNPVDALAVHAGGWIALVAAMRGVARAFEIEDRSMTRLVLVGIPALGIPWAIGLLGPPELRPTFTESAFVGSIAFTTAGFIAAGLARLQEIGRETGVDWRHERSWMATVLAVLVAVLAIGIPASMLLGLPGTTVARAILEPIITLLAYAIIVVIALGAMAAGLIASALRAAGFAGFGTPDGGAAPPAIPEVVPYTIDELRGPLTGLGLAWFVVAVVIVVLVTVWIRRRRRPGVRGQSDERSFRLARRLDERPPSPSVTAAGASGAVVARDAVTAYLAALDDIASSDPELARAEHETPRAHARRAAIGAELDGLQAAYALARYGERSLTRSEDRRALSRLGRLRSRLRT